MNCNDVAQFLDVAGKKGFLTGPVLKQTLTAIEKLQAVAEADPDQPNFDLAQEGVVEDLFRRFMTIKAGELSPDSANVYISRVKKAVDNCARYKQDPLAYKSTFAMGGATKSVSSDEKSKKAKLAKTSEAKNPNTDAAPTISEDTFLASYPLRKNQMLKMYLPKDLKAAEVHRLAIFLLSQCEDFNPQRSNVFYGEAPAAASRLEHQ